MANKGLTKKEEFFKELNLISTKKVKVKYCRTIKERLRPSVQQESLALPKKIVPASSPGTSGNSVALAGDKKKEELKLRGGISLLKSMKKQQRLERLKGENCPGPSVPSSKSLLSYLHRPSVNSNPDDSSSVDSEIDEGMEEAEKDLAIDAEDTAHLAEVNASSSSSKNKRNGMVKDLEPRMKKVSVEMRKMRKERWSLDTVGSSGDESVRLVAGFATASVSERGVRNKQAAYRKLIGSLEHELEEEERALTPPLEKATEEMEVEEEQPPLTVRLVEDFSLQSESDDDDAEAGEDIATLNIAPEQDLDTEVVEVKVEYLEQDAAEEKVSETEENELLVDEKSKVDFLDTLCLQSVSSLRCSNSGSRDATSRRTLNQHHQVLKELEQRTEQKTPRKKGRRLKEDTAVTEDFGSDELNRLVERVRRESKIALRSKSLYNMRLRVPEARVIIMERRRYLTKVKDQEQILGKHLSKLLAEDSPLWRRRRLTRPTVEEEGKCREIARIPSHLFVSSSRREQKRKEEETRKSLALISQEVTSSLISRLKMFDNTSSSNIESSSISASCPKSIEDADRNDEHMLTSEGNNTSILIEDPDQNRISPVPDLVNYEHCTKSLSSKVGKIENSETIKNNLDLWSTEQSSSKNLVQKCHKDQTVENVIKTSPHNKNEEDGVLLNTLQNSSCQNMELCKKVEKLEEIDPVPNSLETREILDDGLVGCDLLWPKADQAADFATVENQEVSETAKLGTLSTANMFDEEKDKGSPSSKKFRCLDCGKELNTKNGLDYHMRTHSGDHPFQCDICFKRFKSSSLCSRHRQIHNSDKKFSCKICGKAFAQKSNLSKHMDIHAGVRPFQCRLCPKSFTQKVHLECHAMTHTKDKPWQCSHCRTRFSKKSSLVRHFQNAHDVVRTNLTEAEDEHTKEAGEYPRSDLTIVSVPDLTTDDTHKNDVGDMNSQFDVEVSFCEDIGDILNVPNDTLFIMDTAEVHSKDSVGNPELSKDADTENLEEIEKFLEESKAEPVPKISKTTKETKEVRISKDNTYRIPKSPKKPATLKPHQQQTPHIPYQKEASLSVVSVGLNSVKRKDATSSTSISKSTLTSPKKLSFEEALNVALAPSSKRERTRPVHKSIKVIKAGPMSSNSFFKQKLCHSQSPASTLSSSSTTSTLQESACDAIRKELQGKKPAGPASEDLSPTKTVSGAGGSCGMVGSRRVDPCTNTNHQDPKTRSRSTEKVKNCHELITKRKEHHSNATKPLKRSPEKATGSEQHLVRGKMDSTAPRPHIGPSQHHQSEMRTPQDKDLLPLNPDFSSPAHTLGHSNRNTSSSSPKEDRRQHVGMVSSQPLSPEAARGLSLTLEMSPKLQASLTSALSSIAANQATGYYTSNAASSEPSRSRSEDVEYGKGDVEKQALTLLPSNFPTFDATSTYSLLNSLQSLSSKPTAVVSPSRCFTHINSHILLGTDQNGNPIIWLQI